jgi:glycosyltransferase involved in cell wall biosynthesis
MPEHDSSVIRPVKILHLGKYYPPAPGGIESHVQTLARAQAELGHEVNVLCVNHADQNGKDITHSRWRKTSAFTHTDGKVKVDRVGRWFGISRLEICPTLVGRMRKATSEADIVHLHTPNPLMLAAWWIAGNRKTPLVVTHHSDVIKQKVLQKAVAPFEKWVYCAASLILSDSPNYIDGSSILKGFREKVEVLPLGIDLALFLNPGPKEKESTERLKEIHGFPLWLMVGRMTYYKGYHVALEALARVCGKMIIVGTGPLEFQLKSLANQLGVLDRITWEKSVSQSNLVALYHAATALWFPSVARSEGFGLVQVEAMASGCPVINTLIPGSGVSWVSQHMQTGISIDVGNSNALSESAMEIFSNSALRMNLAKGAKIRAKEHFSSMKMAEACLEKYNRIVGGNE